MGKILRQAGVIPYRIVGGALEVLLITSRDTGRWVIPKGYIEKGRTAPQAGLQEAWEEAGVLGPVASKIPLGCFTYVKTLETGEVCPANIEVYAMRVTREESKWPERKERHRKWFSPAEAADRINEPGLAALLLKMVGLYPKTRGQLGVSGVLVPSL